MPGSREFNETIATTTQKKKSRTPKLLEPVDLIGHTLMLNTALIGKFQCGGFVLGPHRPLAIVDHNAQQFPLRAALAKNELLDVTGQDMTKGYKGKGGETSAVSEQDTGKRVFVATDRRGNLYVATPRTKAEAKKFETELRKTGRIKSIDFSRDMTGFAGGITEEVIETSLPTKKAKKNVSSRRTAGNTRRSRN